MAESPDSNDFPWICPYEPATVDLGRILRRPAWARDYTTWCSNLFCSLPASWKIAKAILANYYTLKQAIK